MEWTEHPTKATLEAVGNSRASLSDLQIPPTFFCLRAFAQAASKLFLPLIISSSDVPSCGTTSVRSFLTALAKAASQPITLCHVTPFTFLSHLLLLLLFVFLLESKLLWAGDIASPTPGPLGAQEAFSCGLFRLMAAPPAGTPLAGGLVGWRQPSGMV